MLRLLLKYILAINIALTIFSCERIKRKEHQVVNKTKNVISGQIGKVFPLYDHDKPDTEHNKSRFKEHLQIDLTDDVNSIYTYGDFLGADYKVLIAFTCDTATIRKIIRTKKMQLTPFKDDDGLIFVNEFKWWDKDKIELLEPYKVGKEGEYWQYLWYDPLSKQAFYEEFSL